MSDRSRLGATHAAVLAALLVAAAARGLFWVAVTDVWRGDEHQHYSYVSDLAEGRGLPVLGVDRITDEVAALGKASPTNGRISTTMSPHADDPEWGATAEQYEAGQGPLYYALLAVPHRLAAGADPLARFFLVRVASLALALTALPLTWLLARAITPDRPVVWLLAPALLTTWQGWNHLGSGVTNDAAVTPLCVAALAAVAWAWRRGPTYPLALGAGGAFGLALLTKPSAATIALPLAIGGVAALVRHRPGWLRWLAWPAVAAGTAAVLFLPWLAWQRRLYGPEGAEGRFNTILGPIIGRAPWDAETLSRYLRDATSDVFNLGEYRPPFERYTLVFLGALAIATVAGAVAAAVRRRGDEAFGLVWLATALPLAFATMVGVVRLALDGYGTVVGRYLAPAVPATAVVIAAGAVLALGRRAGVVAVALLAALALTLEVDLDREYVARTYLRGLPQAGTAPALVQEWADRYDATATVEIAAPCPATAVGLAYKGGAAPAVALRTPEIDAPVTPFAAETLHGDVSMSYYLVDPPSERLALTVTASTPAIAVADADRDPRLSLAGTPGDPVARVYCRDDDPHATRFAQTHGPLHPDLPFALVDAWPAGWALAGWVLVAVALVTSARGRGGRRGSAGRSPPR